MRSIEPSSTLSAVSPSRPVPMQSPLDRSALVWRLMRLLPALLGDEVFAPIAGFLRGGDLERQLQLAERLADMFDQYQVYRADWLESWAGGSDTLVGYQQRDVPLPPDQRWQAALWRALLAELTETEPCPMRVALRTRLATENAL